MQRRIADIEVLRGLAIALVVLHNFKNVLIADHSPRLNALFSYFDFWIGIDIFFAISGFVVARNLLPQLGADISLKQFVDTTLAFWIKRMLRLWPSAWLWLLLMLPAAVFCNRSGSFGTLTANIEAAVVGVLQVANFRFLAASAQHFEYGASFVYWSLSQIEQFYVLLPLLAFALKRRFVSALVALLVVKAALTLLFPELAGTLLTWLLRVDALLIGVLLAVWAEQPGYRLFEPTVFDSRFGRLTLLPLLLVCSCVLAADGMHVVPDPFRFSVIGLVAAMPVFIASYDKNYLCRAAWLQAPLLWLGSRAYSIFLVHVPAFLLTKEIWFRRMPADTLFDDVFNTPFALTSLCLILVLSEFNYRFVEQPLRRRGVAAAERFLSARQALASADEGRAVATRNE